MRITTAGESHGKGLVAVIEGLPQGLKLDPCAIDRALAARRRGCGRSDRQRTGCDRAEIVTGADGFVTTGAPLTVWISNGGEEGQRTAPLTALRPGHADLAGLLKFNGTDARAVSERASARETAVRVAAGEICRGLLSELGVRIGGYVREYGAIKDEREYSFEELDGRDPETGMADVALSDLAKRETERCRALKDTLGGVIELRVSGLKSGFGSCMTSSEKLDARLAAALFGVQAIKGVEIGLGFASAARMGSEVHDEIGYDPARGYFHKTNRAGGIEGGMSNGEELVLRAAMKPLPTLAKGLATVDCKTKQPTRAAEERSDVCALPACLAVLEGVLACELAAVVLERLGGDTMEQVKRRYGELPQ